MQVLPPMPAQTTNPLQHAVPDNGEPPQQAQLPTDEYGLSSFIVPNSSELLQQASLPTDLLSLNPLLEITPQVGQLLQQESISDNLLGLNCLQFLAPNNGQSSQQSVLPHDLLNFDPLALEMYPAFGDALLQNLPHSGYTDQLASTSHEQHNQLDSHHNGPSQFDSSDPYQLSMNQAIIAVPSVDEIPIGGTQVIGGSSPLRHGPAPDLRPANPLLVDMGTTSSYVYNYNVPSAQNLARATTQSALFEERANAVAQKQHPTADNQQRNGKRGPFRDQALREQTAQTRRMGSCLRCRMQRIRVSNNLPSKQNVVSVPRFTTVLNILEVD